MFRTGLVLTVAAFLAAAAPIQSPSQPPANSQGAQAPSKPESHGAADDHRGTEHTPLIVKLATPPENKTKTAQDQKERDRQAITEKRLADYTWYLALATFALVAVAMAQAGLFVWQLIYMREGVKDARDNAQATLKMANLARDEFNATHRPQIVVHAIQPASAALQGGGIAIGAYVSFFNIGTVPARNVRLFGMIVPMQYGTDLQAGIAPTALRSNAEPVAPGTSNFFNVSSNVNIDRTLTRGGDHVLPPEVTLYCVGTIVYDDAAAVTRQTGFCWRWNEGNWNRVLGSTYDYSY